VRNAGKLKAGYYPLPLAEAERFGNGWNSHCPRRLRSILA